MGHRIPVEMPSWAFILLLAVLLTPFIVVCIQYILRQYLQRGTAKWIETKGEILYSATRHLCPSILNWREGYFVVVEYEYIVDDKEYVGSRISYIKQWIPSEEIATRMADSYRSGDKVKVYYCPQKPYISVLEKDNS